MKAWGKLQAKKESFVCYISFLPVLTNCVTDGFFRELFLMTQKELPI